MGVLCNEWILAKLFSPDGVLALETRIKIWFFDVVLILVGSIITSRERLMEGVQKINENSRSYPRLVAFVMGSIFSLFVLALAEIVFYTINSYKKDLMRETVYFSRKLYIDDALLGYKMVPNIQTLHRKTVNEKVEFAVTYSTDQHGRRITPIDNDQNRNEFFLFTGCSFIFGHGVKADETLPFYVGQLTRTYKPYNYGVSGYGPQSLLAKLQEGGIVGEITEKQGILVYLFLDDHLFRAMGSMQIVNAWGAYMPYYTLSTDGKLVRRGNFVTGRPMLSLLYKVLGASQIATYYNINLHGKIKDYHIQLTARIIEESRNMYRQAFQNDNFYVLFYPGTKHGLRMIPEFQRAGIKYLNYSALFNPADDGFAIEHDGHPTPKAHWTVAAKLVEDLGIGTPPPQQ